MVSGVGITAGWGETEVFMEVSSRRLAISQHRHLPAHGLLSLISLLRAFLLTGTIGTIGTKISFFSARPRDLRRLASFRGDGHTPGQRHVPDRPEVAATTSPK